MPMTTSTISQPVCPDGQSVRADVQIAGEVRQVVFRASEGPVSAGIDGFLTAALIPAMSAGAPLHADGSTAPGLLANLRVVQDVFRCWNRKFRKIELVARDPEASVQRGAGVGCFFSGGVDSFYTLVKNLDKITTLVFVHGLDIGLDNEPFRREVSARIRAVARALNKAVVEVETNIRDFSDRFADWGKYYHGAALASVAHLLAPQLRKVYVPATHTYADLFVWGSHPLSDPWWGSDAVAVVHDGCEATRVDKVGRIAACEPALKHLRVCCATGDYNCGRCEKCLRTMINLFVVGALDRSETFPRELNLARISRISAEDANTRAFIRDNLDALEDAAARPHTELVRALRQALAGRYNRYHWRLLRRWRDRAWPDHPGLYDALDTLLNGRLAAGARMLCGAVLRGCWKKARRAARRPAPLKGTGSLDRP
jgi:hypothetical protein